MLTYEVTYTYIPTGKSTTIKDVIADGLNGDGTVSRYFVMKNNSRFEIPTRSMIFYFSPDRAGVIEANKKSEAKNG